MGKTGKLFVMAATSALIIGTFAMNFLALDLPSKTLWTFLRTGFWFSIVWFLSMWAIAAPGRKIALATTTAILATSLNSLSVRAPATTGALQRVVAVADATSKNRLTASTIQTYTDEPCNGLPFFGTDELNGKPVPLVGYVYREGRYRCFNIQQHLDRPGVDTNGNQINLVTREVHALIKQQIAQDVARATP